MGDGETSTVCDSLFCEEKSNGEAPTVCDSLLCGEMSDGETPAVCDRVFVGSAIALLEIGNAIAFVWGDKRWCNVHCMRSHG
ncbi:hypothetical protein [Microcoleus sp. B9-D4]|uniref:hypothetical protein n=1 Tax=Microcoleus sp. B9-D4 TaxID=2818711 RepID=UPI002FD160EE